MRSRVVKVLDILKGCFTFVLGVAFYLDIGLILTLASTILSDIEEIKASLDTLDFEGFTGTVYVSVLLYIN